MATRTRIVAGFIALGFVAGFAGASRADDKKADASGTWTWKFQRQNGEESTSTLKVKQEGEKLTGKLDAFGSEVDVQEGKVDKDGNVSFQVVRDFGGNSVTIKYKGKLDGDMMKLHSEFERDGEVRKRDFDAKRQKDKA
ncbi:MAG TPA: hypothetical protein VGH33_09675 [Isosphaeraceae bacterium]|jgi:hypothetical protein